jgi:hypothetical protein
LLNFSFICFLNVCLLMLSFNSLIRIVSQSRLARVYCIPVGETGIRHDGDEAMHTKLRSRSQRRRKYLREMW